MEKIITVLALITILLTPTAQAYTIYGFPGVSCGSWTSARGLENMKEAQYASWVLGFVSGAGYAEVKMKETDSQAMLAWVDNYCGANPLDTIVEAIKELIATLEDKAK